MRRHTDPQPLLLASRPDGEEKLETKCQAGPQLVVRSLRGESRHTPPRPPLCFTRWREGLKHDVIVVLVARQHV